MSVNKDLEIIKHNEPKQIWNQEDGDFYLLFVPEMWDIVIQTAERMAAEIEHLNTLLNEESIRANVLERCVEEREAEIACLKDELEKRPQVVRCVECSKHKQPSCPWHRALIMSDPNEAFCSYGKRSESEEGK